MKVTRRNVLHVLAGLCFVFCLRPVTALANTTANIDLNAEVGYFYYPKAPDRNSQVILTTDRQLKKLRSDHPETAVLEKKAWVNDYGNPYNDLSIRLKGPGVSRLSFRMAKGKNVKSRAFSVQVVKYTNPFRSIRIGEKEWAHLFRNDSAAKTEAPNGEAKIDLQCNKGWKLIRLDFYKDYGDEAYHRLIQNGAVDDIYGYDTLYACVLHEKSHRLLRASLSFYGEPRFDDEP